MKNNITKKICNEKRQKTEKLTNRFITEKDKGHY